MQVYELITCVRRANENAGNLISGVQFLINIYILNKKSISLQNGENFTCVIILQTETIFFFYFACVVPFRPLSLLRITFFPSLKMLKKELPKIHAVKTAKENKQTNKKTTVRNLATFYFLSPQGTFNGLILRMILRSKFLIHRHLKCYKAKDTSSTWKFCFLITDHVILWRESSFGHFQTHVYICSCREWDTIPLRINTWSILGKQNLKAKEVWLVVSAIYLRRSQLLNSKLKK